MAVPTSSTSQRRLSRGAGMTATGLLAVALISQGVAHPTSAMTAPTQDARAQPRTSIPPTTAYAIIKTLPVGQLPTAVAVNDADDTIYVANSAADSVTVISGRTGTSATIASGDEPSGISVNQVDDTVYVANFSDDSLTVVNGRTGTIATPIPVGNGPLGIAVNSDDDTVYVALSLDDSVRTVNGRTAAISTAISVGQGPDSVVVDQVDDTVYVADRLDDSVSVINGRLGAVDDTIGVADEPSALALDGNDDTVYVTSYAGGTLSVINGRNGVLTSTVPLSQGGQFLRGVAAYQADDTVFVAGFGAASGVTVLSGRNLDDSVTLQPGTLSQPWGIAVDQAGTNAGVAYVTNAGNDTLSMVAAVTPASSPSSGPSGSTLTISLSVPHLSPEIMMDDSTLTSVYFEGLPPVTAAPGNGNTWTVTVPDGSGSVQFAVELNGGQVALAGTFTYTDVPSPVVFPPSAPREVTAMAGNASASVTWRPPADSGSFPVTDYEVRVIPGSHSCVIEAPALTCSLSGLTNGIAYTATVRALNGAGWGPYSTPSAEFTPQAPPSPSITIAGTRGDVRGKPGIIVTGATAGFVEGDILRPWFRFRGQIADTQGKARIRVAGDGTFTWKRRTGRKIYAVIKSADATIVSNRIVISP